MCFEAPTKYMHTDRKTDANDTILHSSLVLINFPTHTVVQPQIVNIQYMGVKYGYLHVLDLLSLSLMFCIPVLNISPLGKYHSIQNQFPDHAIGLL